MAEFKAQANLGNFVVYKRGARGPVKRSGKQFAEMGGFTLLELLVVGAVVVVVGTLGEELVPSKPVETEPVLPSGYRSAIW